RVWQAPQLFGEGSAAGGGAHLVGSLADLPYVLSEMEQDFIAPENVQALIWRELVPGLLTSAILPRWWSVSRNELHAIALYQRAGEELLTASVENERLRSQVMNILSDRELLNVKPFPAFKGYSSRLLAESWDSSNLYWGRLADEMGYSPVMLNRLIPELTRRMVEKIFATDVEDWQAMLRAMRETGDEFRQGKIVLLSTTGSTTSRR